MKLVRFKWSVILEWVFSPSGLRMQIPAYLPAGFSLCVSANERRRLQEEESQHHTLRSSFRNAWTFTSRAHGRTGARLVCYRLVWVTRRSYSDWFTRHSSESNPWPRPQRVSIFRSCDGMRKDKHLQACKNQGNDLMKWDIKEYCCTGVKCVDWSRVQKKQEETFNGNRAASVQHRRLHVTKLTSAALIWIHRKKWCRNIIWCSKYTCWSEIKFIDADRPEKNDENLIESHRIWIKPPPDQIRSIVPEKMKVTAGSQSRGEVLTA